MNHNGAIDVVKPGHPDPAPRDELAAYIGSTDLSHCLQCGVCSGSCPTMPRMEDGPRRIMHMIHLGQVDNALRSPDIWLCVSCYSCETRCPQGVPVTRVMSALRNRSVASLLATDKEAAFSQIFVRVMLERGRLCEPELLLRYFASKPDLRNILEMAPMGLRMLLKGKISLLPERIEGASELESVVEKIYGGIA